MIKYRPSIGLGLHLLYTDGPVDLYIHMQVPLT